MKGDTSSTSGAVCRERWGIMLMVREERVGGGRWKVRWVRYLLVVMGWLRYLLVVMMWVYVMRGEGCGCGCGWNCICGFAPRVRCAGVIC